MTIKLKRANEGAERGDGVLILVDRLWPRGVQKITVDLWLKDVTPADALRNWFGHEPARWTGFRRKYRRELAENKHAVRKMRPAVKGRTATLLYGARDTEHNQAVVLAQYLKPRRKKTATKGKKATKAAR